MTIAFPFARTAHLSLLGATALALLTGCHSAPSVSHPITPARSVAALNAARSVQASPLYHQAQQACQHKQFAHAAELLQRLAATPGLSKQEVAFCQQQRTLCLQDAGLLPKTPPSAPTKPAASADADCGPRALAFVCEKLGVKTSLAQLRQAAGTNAQGTTMEGLQKAAQSLGLKAEGEQVSREALSEVQPPAIAWVNGNHYIALLSLEGGGEGATAVIHDPNAPKEQTISQERLLQLSSGYLLLVHR